MPSQAGQIKLQVQCLRLKPMRLETVDTDRPKGRLAGNLAELDSARQWWASRCSWSGGHRGAASNDTPTETFA